MATNQADLVNAFKRFGVVTVMNAKVFKSNVVDVYNKVKGSEPVTDLKQLAPAAVLQQIAKLTNVTEDTDYITMDYLKVANIEQDNSEKTITGGQNASQLYVHKYGKTTTCTIQAALGNANAISWLQGGQYDSATGELNITDEFNEPVFILGETYIIDQAKGSRVPCLVGLFQFAPNSVLNLTQDAEGDATVFDMNGSLNAVQMLVNKEIHNVFYSIVPVETKAE